MFAQALTNSLTQKRIFFQTSLLQGSRHAAPFIISGADATRYLHARLSQDIKTLTQSELRQSLVLTPQGKIQGKFFIAKLSDSDFFIACEQSEHANSEELISAILKFKVADRVDSGKLEELCEYFVLSGAGCSEVISSTFSLALSGKNFVATPDMDAAFLAIKWGKQQIILSYCTKNSAEKLRLALSAKQFENVGSDKINSLRVSLGVPVFKVDYTKKNNATDIPYEELISFSKGCYTGQELVEMSVARGRPNKKIVWLTSNELSLKPEDPIETVNSKGQTEIIGAVTSAATIDNLSLALAMVKNIDQAEIKYFSQGKELSMATCNQEN